MPDILKISDNLEVGVGVLARVIDGATMARLWVEWCNVNSQHREAVAFAVELEKAHNTLQASVLRLLWQILRQVGQRWNANAWTTDGRNQEAVAACSQFYYWTHAGKLPEDWPLI